MSDQIQQDYRIEIRFDFTGTEEDVRYVAQEAAGLISGGWDGAGTAEVTAIFDENWEEIR